MKPLFKEFNQLLWHYRYPQEQHFFEMPEKTLWFDRNIIKGIRKSDGEVIKLVRLYVDMDGRVPHVRFHFYNEGINFDSKIYESWDETITRLELDINYLENESLILIKNYLDDNPNSTPMILTSEGKDSKLTQHLVRKVNPNVVSMFNNTSLDCADTYKAVKNEENIIITNPTEGFYQWQKRLEYVPTRFSRACCTIFKEGQMVEWLDESDKYKDKNILFFMGMRNEESNTRSGYGDEWKNDKWGDREWNALLPIREWSETMVWLYFLREKINFNEKYKKGYNRVGCAVACPYLTKATWMLDYFWYNNLYNRWHDIIEADFIKNKKWTRMNCTVKEAHTCWNGGKLRDEPTEEVIQEFADHMELEYGIAKSFFSHKCNHDECNRNVVDGDLIAMNMKLLGRNTDTFYCKKHLKDMFDMNNKQYNQSVEDFKQDGCSLF